MMSSSRDKTLHHLKGLHSVDRKKRENKTSDLRAFLPSFRSKTACR
jgi:hypothetical protein